MINIQELDQNRFKIGERTYVKGDYYVKYFKIYRDIDSINIQNKYTLDFIFEAPVAYVGFTGPSGSFTSLSNLGEYINSVISPNNFATNNFAITNGSNLFMGNQFISGTLTVTGPILFTASYAESSSNALSSSYSEFSSTSSYSPNYLPISGGIISGSLSIYGNSSITGSLNAPHITGSLFGTASNATNAATSSNILGGKATHIPYFETDTTLATSSIFQSGSTSIIINQDNNTEDNPEALYVWQPHPTSINVISGKGNLNNYLQLNIHNTNNGISASSDVVATANNGTETDKFIDMGINGGNFIGNGNGLGEANDAYLYSTGNDLYIGNYSNGKYIYIFNSSSVEPIISINPNNDVIFKGNVSTTGSFQISGSTYQIGNNNIIGNNTITGSNNILGNSILSGSISIYGNTSITGSITALNQTASFGFMSASFLDITGKQTVKGYTKYLPTNDIVPIDTVGGYIYSSGTLGDLYFAQTNGTLTNNVKLRWLEGNMYTGLLNGGVIASSSSTVFTVSSGSGIIVSLNGSLSTDPYPTVKYITWNNLSSSISPLSASYDQSFISIEATGSFGKIYSQGMPYNDGQYNSLIPIGVVLHQNRSTINLVKTNPSLAYGIKQRQTTFIQAFGPLKLSGFTVSPSGSSTGSLIVGGGTAFADGANYVIDVNNPSYIIDQGTNISKIWRYYDSGSAWKYDTNNGNGYVSIDPTRYSLNGVLASVPGTGANREWSIQRVYWFPNSVSKAIVVYYGNNTYLTEADAILNISIENFVEAPNTAANAIYIGSIVVRNDATFTDSNSFKIIPGGLFRQIGGSGGGGSVITQNLVGLSDVNISSPTDKQPLVYNSSTLKWSNASSINADLIGTSSFSTNSISSSYSITSSYSLNTNLNTGSLLLTSSFNNYTSSISSQFAGTSSYASNAQNLLGVANTSLTSSYSTNFNISNTLTLDGTLTDYILIPTTIVGVDNLYTRATGSFTSAFSKYTVSKGSNARSGEFMSVWNGSSSVYTDTSTTDIGNTSDISFQSSIVSNDIQINSISLSSGWKIKILTTFM